MLVLMRSTLPFFVAGVLLGAHGLPFAVVVGAGFAATIGIAGVMKSPERWTRTSGAHVESSRRHRLRIGLHVRPTWAAIAGVCGVVHGLPSPPLDIPERDGGLGKLRGVVTAVRPLPASPTSSRTMIEATVGSVVWETPERARTGSIAVRCPDRLDLAPGQEIEVLGWLRAGAGRPVVFASHPRAVTIHATRRGRFHATVRTVRRRLQYHIERHLPARAAAMAKELVLGLRDDDVRRRDVFRRAGVLPFFAVSGLHLGLLAWIALHLTARFPHRLRGVVFIGTLFAYVLITGSRPPVVRAFLMVLLYRMAWRNRRSCHGGWILLVVATMTLIAEASAARDPAFLMSFAAVAGLVWIAAPLVAVPPTDDPLLRFLRRKQKHPIRRAIVRGLGAAWAVVLATAPVTLPVFGTLTPVALISGLVFGPLIAVVLPLALLATALPIFGTILEPAARLVDAAAHVFARVPGGFLEPGTPATLAILVHVAALVIAALRLGRGASKLWIMLPTLSLIAMTIRLPVTPSDGLTVIDMGQGAAVLVETGDRTILVDAGSSSRQDGGARILRERLRDHGRDHIDMMFLSHVDADHVGAVDDLLTRLSVGWVGLPARIDSDRAGRDLIEKLRRHDIPFQRLAAGDEVIIGDVVARVLGPPRQPSRTNRSDVASHESSNIRRHGRNDESLVVSSNLFLLKTKDLSRP